MTHLFRASLLGLTASILTLSWSVPASAQRGEVEDDRSLDEQEEVRSMSFGVMPFLRLGAGVSAYPSVEAAVEFDLDIDVGLRYELTQGRRIWLELVPEVGYTYHHGDQVTGHYGVVGAGLRLGGLWFAGCTITSLLLGSRQDAFDLGVRAGLRLEAALGLIGLEVSWEGRDLRGEGLHALRVLLIFDAAVVLAPMLFTRLGWAFGRRG